MRIIQEKRTSNLNSSLAALTAEDFKTELHKLEDQVTVQQGDLRDLEKAHEARPYRPEFMNTMRRGYVISLRELHSQIETVRSVMQ